MSKMLNRERMEQSVKIDALKEEITKKERLFSTLEKEKDALLE